MIIYTVIGREFDGAVLVESSQSNVGGNYPLIATQLLEKLRDDPNLVPMGNRKTFVHRHDAESGGVSEGTFAVCVGEGSLWDMGASWFGGDASEPSATVAGLDHYFHVLHGESSYYICLSDDTGRQAGVNFGYLEDLQREFASRYTPNKINKANAYGMNNAFAPNIGKLSYHYNTNRGDMETDQRILKLTSQMEDLKKVMGHNINMIMDRGDSLDILATKSDQLEHDASVFKKRTRTLKHKVWWDYFKSNLIYIALAFALFLLLSFMMCGFGWSRCRASD